MKQQARPILRGDIYYADLSPVVGCEQGGIRPVLILQNNVGNRYSPTIIVAAITSQQKKELPTHVPIPEVEGISKRSVVLLEQIRTIDRSRLRDWVGSIDNRLLFQINEALKVSVGLTPNIYRERSI